MDRARASLSRRLDALGNRVARVRRAVDVPGRIAERPWHAVAIALAAGIVVGARRRAAPARPGERHPVRDAVFAMMSAAAAKLVRDAVTSWLLKPRDDRHEVVRAPIVVTPSSVR
jgi:hypothetical protein